jgi:hypothetical protein
MYNYIMTYHIKRLIGAASTRITPNGTHSGMDITLQNVSESATIYIGGEGVSTTNYGFRLSPGQAFSIELPGLDALYAAASDADTPLAILQTGLEAQD